MWIRLNSIASFSSGKTPSMDNQDYYGDSTLWVTSKDMKTKYIVESQIMLSPLGVTQMRIYEPNTILMVARSGILRHSVPVAILRRRATINQDIKAIALYYPTLAEYIYIFIKGLESFIISNFTKSGTTVESLVFEKFQKILIPIPPEDEIQRIQEKCKTLIAQLDKIDSNYSSLEDDISYLKSKILDFFFSNNSIQFNFSFTCSS